MKNGKKPTLAQKKFLQDTGLDSEKWLIVKDTPEEMVIVSRNGLQFTAAYYCKGDYRLNSFLRLYRST